jgi:hypothetical protein
MSNLVIYKSRLVLLGLHKAGQYGRTKRSELPTILRDVMSQPGTAVSKKGYKS